MKCHKCQTEKETKNDRVPRGWKRHNEAIWCGDCWKDSYCLRAITLRVASPCEGWPEFRAAIKDAWIESTRLANWITTQCYVRDVRREPGVTKMPPMPKVYLYPEAREKFPTLPSQSVAAAEQRYKANYSADRYKVIWTCEQSLRNYRYPEPFTAPNQGWTASYEQEEPTVQVRIGDSRWRLRLKGGHRYRRQLRAFAQIVSGDAIQGELAIYRQRAKGGEGEVTERDSGGQRATHYVMVKLVAWFPKQPIGQQRDGILYARTDADSLLIALNAKDERLWQWHADHVRRWVSEHRQQLQRWSDDQKAEQRPVADFQSRRETAVKRYHRRMKTEVDRCARQLVNYALRRRFAAIRYDDTCKNFVDRFPWHQLKTRIQTLCKENNLTFDYASGQATEKSGQSLASEK